MVSADKALDASVRLGPIDARLVQEPYGVVAGVIPFNWPPIHTAAKAAPALAAGNTVVLKPPEQAPLTILRIVELLQEVLPPDVVSVVPGAGAVGDALVSHPLVGKISFTGSPFTAQHVLRAAAAHLTPSVLELGGKCPLIVLDDADLDLALGGIIEGAFFNQGEACTAVSRLLVHESRYREVLDRLAVAVPRLRLGDGCDPTDPRRPHDHRAARPARPRLRRAGPRGGRERRDHRCPSDGGTVGRRSFRGAGGLHRRPAGHAHRPGGDLRSGAHGAAVRLR